MPPPNTAPIPVSPPSPLYSPQRYSPCLPGTSPPPGAAAAQQPASRGALLEEIGYPFIAVRLSPVSMQWHKISHRERTKVRQSFWPMSSSPVKPAFTLEHMMHLLPSFGTSGESLGSLS
ncbi:hypothetical protein DOTSEDRAFT_69942 [Dothistroma septosporum NZE10]|uniref:Uncharacterized protein n=1 Tax=Dothistroma septosporum (strain NZE10 / CBS 128990) TaxID=675120 RepID=N1PXM6_DOTSN|nr:hypothetical protein DOTSEDRAFT_69942 [Dothistroma septosporum NZE10]